MRDALDGTVSCQFWVFLFGSTCVSQVFTHAQTITLFKQLFGLLSHSPPSSHPTSLSAPLHAPHCSYGYVPHISVMSACSKKFPWFDAFR